MKQNKILIMMQAEIFSSGLQAQLNHWGFTDIEIVKTYETALFSIQNQLPHLIIIGEKLADVIVNLLNDSVIPCLQGTPIIFISKKLADTKHFTDLLNKNGHYWVLNYPCTEIDLKATIEDIFNINIPAV